jgi:RND family efflux transporter MFP subunit
MRYQSFTQVSLIGTLLFAAAFTTGCGNRDSKVAASIPAAAPVKVQQIRLGTTEESSSFVGSLEAQQRVTLQPQIQGRIQAILVSSGQRVQRGTPILELSVDQTEANAASSVAATNAQQAAVSTAQAQLQAAVATREKTVSAVRLQQAEFDRNQYLVSQGALARQQLDIARNNLNSAIADLRAAEKQVAANQAAVRQAQANVQVAKATAAASQVNVNFKRVTAPIAGVVGTFAVKVGDYVNTGQTLTTLVQNNALDLNLSIPSNRSNQLRTNLPVQLLDPTTNRQIGTGSIYYIAPSVDPTQQSILSRARFPNSQGRLRDGQYVQARIIWNQRSGVLIPTTAITRIGGQSFVFVTAQTEVNGKPQTVVHQRLVKLGDIQGSNYQVIDGLKPGETIVTSGILSLREGAPVQPQS